jgi:hypothetical protein
MHYLAGCVAYCTVQNAAVLQLVARTVMRCGRMVNVCDSVSAQQLQAMTCLPLQLWCRSWYSLEALDKVFMVSTAQHGEGVATDADVH